MNSVRANDLLSHVHLKSHSVYWRGRLTGMAAGKTNGIQVSVGIYHDHTIAARKTAPYELLILTPAIAIYILEFVYARGNDNGSAVDCISIWIQKFKRIRQPIDRIQSGSKGKCPGDVHARRIDDFLTHVHVECQGVAVGRDGRAGFAGREADHRERCIP